MLLIQYILFFLLMLIYDNSANQNGLSLLTDNYNQRIKRFLSRKSFKSKLNSQTRSKNNQQPEDILFNSELYDQGDQEKQNKGFTQQELSEINRILSKKENDYYGILGINKHATPYKIMSAYKKLSLRVHPDKFNAPGATEATQRLNKARTELLKKFENQNQYNNQGRTKTFTTQSFTFNENKNHEVTDISDKSDSILPFSPSPSEKIEETSKSNSFFNKSIYLLFASILFIIGILIFIIFYKKRQRHYSLTNEKISKKQNIDTPESNNGNVISMNDDSEASIIQDDDE